MKYLKIVVFLFFVAANLCAQKPLGPKLSRVTRVSDVYVHQYQVLASDTSIRQGEYLLMYKDQVLERGIYENNKRVGEWLFFNYRTALEFAYSYDNGEVSRFLKRESDSFDSPCFFLGSPVLPYRFLASRIYFPNEEMLSQWGKEIVLIFKIGKDGRMKHAFLEQEAHKELNDIVMDAAKSIPPHWRWIPARLNGEPVESEYVIRIIFGTDRKGGK